MDRNIILLNFPCNHIRNTSKLHNIPLWQLEYGITFRIVDIFILPILDKYVDHKGGFKSYTTYKNQYNRLEGLLRDFENDFSNLLNINPLMKVLYNDKNMVFLDEVYFFYKINTIGVALTNG